MAKMNIPAFSTELLDQLLVDQDPTAVLRSDRLVSKLKKALAERMLHAELDIHLTPRRNKSGKRHLFDFDVARSITFQEGAVPFPCLARSMHLLQRTRCSRRLHPNRVRLT